MEVKYIILLCLIVVRQTSGWGTKSKIDTMAENVQGKCDDAYRGNDKRLCGNIADAYVVATKDGTRCSNSLTTYEKTIDIKPPTSAPSTMLLWSGKCMGLKAAELKERNATYVTVDETIMGQSFFGSQWMKDGDDISYTEFSKREPDYWKQPTCQSPLEYEFWALLSKKFASQADGVVYVILSADTEGGAYKSDSIFSLYEVDNLPQRSTPITVQVFLYDAAYRSTTCKKEKSILKLEKQVKKRGMTFKCSSVELPPADYQKKVDVWWFEYDIQCDGCVMKLSTHILVIVPFVHLFIK